jgi:hypothetical protein
MYVSKYFAIIIYQCDRTICLLLSGVITYLVFSTT